MNFLENLNDAQRSAVEKIFGPVLVLAGPGTGKTHLLTARIGHILQQTDANPENILCLTFTTAAAVEMRERLRKKIGPAAYRIWIGTFHAFAEWVMTQYPEKFETLKTGRDIADDLQRALAYRDAIRTKNWQYFRPVHDELMNQNDVLFSISKMKRENVSPEKLREMIPEEKERLESDPKNFYQKKYKQFEAGDWKPQAREKIDRTIEKMSEFAELWEVFEKKLANRGGYDFDDLIRWVTDRLKTDENLRFDLQEKFQWVLVDEYQDTNSAQNEIVWALSDYEQPNVFAVGDDDQSIYRFQGASVENVRQFREKFPERAEISLVENYRSGQKILDAAFASVQKNLDRADPERTLFAAGANKKFEEKIERVAVGSRTAEQNWLIEQIQKDLKNGTEPNEIAVLVRKNSEIDELAKILPRFGIPVAAAVRGNILENENVRRAIQLLKIFAAPDLDDELFELLHAPWWEIPSEKLLKLSLQRHEKKSNLVAELLNFEIAFPKFLADSRKNFWHCRPEVLAEKLVYESGMLDWITREKNVESLAAVRKFLDWISDQKCENLTEILERIELLTKLKIKIRPDPLPADHRSVHLLTAHKSKGREFDTVFVPNLIAGGWGNARGKSSNVPLPQLFKDSHDENEEDRRLFFVALTRARKNLKLSHATTDTAGREKTPSIFWFEIPDELAVDLDPDPIEERAQKLLPVLLQSGKNLELTRDEREILKFQVENFVWSATALNSFLECPRRFLFEKLYRFPRRSQPQLALGVALHEALEKTLRGEISAENLNTNFERSLRGQNLTRSDFDRLRAHGLKILEKNFAEKSETWRAENVVLEFDFGKFSPDIDGIRVTGKADKIVFLDGEKSSAKIVDYKSGAPKSIRAGERNWRQLVFYDLLARATNQSWRVENCELEFLTPDSGGKLGTRALEILEKDREIVIEELKSANEKIRNLEFPLVENPDGNADIEFWQNFGK
ncbi:ATP-dependent helicase [bacterium]|nr:ATP-dependent helicase [bacterium]MBT6996073.1 ATP-dependent helicase [bacterium]MBT7772522.1 ATP-dependent helicase [bacterium]